MNAADICKAVEMLNAAGSALRRADVSIPKQMEIGTECYRVAISLEAELAKIGIPVDHPAAFPK